MQGTFVICTVVLINSWTAGGIMFKPLFRDDRSSDDAKCGSGMRVISQFFNCTNPEIEPYSVDVNIGRPGYSLNQAIQTLLSAYCGMILPRGVQCLQSHISACDQKTQEFIIQEVSTGGGFCSGRSVNPEVGYFLASLETADAASVQACPSVDYLPCYRTMESELYRAEVFYLSPEDLAPHVNRSFQKLMRCVVNKYRANSGACPNWQLHFLLRNARTFIPAPVGFRLESGILRQMLQ